ncbi:MAG: hypothetical protein ACRDZ8_04140 [Acidimicrobiales bacterium]
MEVVAPVASCGPVVAHATTGMATFTEPDTVVATVVLLALVAAV